MAKKVDKSTVKELTEKPGGNEEVKESNRPFIKFSQFLREAGEDDRTPDFGSYSDAVDPDDTSPSFGGDNEDGSVDPDDEGGGRNFGKETEEQKKKKSEEP